MRIAVIGAGIVGTLIARELVRYDADVHLFEREIDIGWGVTKANSAIVHGGFHEAVGTPRARFCVEGNELYAALTKELDVPFHRCGAYTVAFSKEDLPTLKALLAQGEDNGIPGLDLHDGATVLAHEPNLNPRVQAGLWSPTVGITEPWTLAIAAVENACANGLTLHLAEEVSRIRMLDGRVCGIATPQGEYPVDAVVNAAGLFADRIAEMVGLSEPILFPCRGEYILLDKKADGLVNSVIFPTPSKTSKGILVLPTVDGGILLGPTAKDLSREENESRETTADGMEKTIDGARRLVPTLDLSLVIKTFAGLRPESPQKEFVVGKSEVQGFFQAAAMRSPGLTAAPAVARFLVHEVMASELSLAKKASFQPFRTGLPRVSELPDEEWSEFISKDPCYGRVICQCNRVTEGEIVAAIHRGARSLDGVKFRTRAGFGRCQGGSCTDRILLILARELGVSPEEVTLRGNGSRMMNGVVRQ
jgi:glycerol-3-phosphate dehydrogenase